MFYTIYEITNKINGKTYTGMHKTDNLDDGYMGSGKLIKRAIEKHGVENFVKVILHIFDNETDMKNKEKEVVVLNENSYNLVEGGHGGFGYINRNPEKYLTEKRMNSLTKVSERSEKRKKLWLERVRKSHNTDSYKENQSAAQKKRFEEKGSWWSGKNHKEETITLMKQSAKGKHDGSKNSQYGTCWITNGFTNKKIKKEDLDFWLEQGYYKGRILGD